MEKSNILELDGVVEDTLPGSMFRVKVKELPKALVCYMSGRLKQNKIRIILGDEVKLEVSAYDLSKGRIVYRL